MHIAQAGRCRGGPKNANDDVCAGPNAKRKRPACANWHAAWLPMSLYRYDRWNPTLERRHRSRVMVGPPQGQIKSRWVLSSSMFQLRVLRLCNCRHAAPQLCCSIADSTYIHDSGGPTHATDPFFPNSCNIAKIKCEPRE